MRRALPCTTTIISGRARKAEQFLVAAETVATIHDDGNPEVGDALVTLYVHAGIAASDVLCCKTLGEHARGQDHTEAVSLLGKVDADLAKHLLALLRRKSKAGYSALPVTKEEIRRAARAATALVDAALRA